MSRAIVIDAGVEFRLRVYLFVIGMVSGVAFTVFFSEHEKERDSGAQAVKTCKLPDADGAMTVYVMESEQIKCWRWK